MMNCRMFKDALFKGISTVLVSFLGFWPMMSQALTFNIPADGSNIVGQVYTVKARAGDNMDTLAQRYDVGYFELIQANPHVPMKDIPAETEILVPAQFILPEPRKDIVINLSEFRFYYYLPNSNKVMTFPIGIGEEGYNTPVGDFTIFRKTKDPVWISPENVRRKIYEQQGIVVPEKVPAGPANPLGDYAMRLNIWSTLIHGTNQPSSVGKRSSAGCIHLYNEDIGAVFNKIPLNTPVHIIDNVYKLTIADGKLYLEAEQPLSEGRAAHKSNMTPMVKAVLNAVGKRHVKINWPMATKVVQRQNGVPTVIGYVTK